MIAVLTWHGKMPSAMTKKMDKIAMPVTTKDSHQGWEFEGNLQDFADKWKDKFIVIPETEVKGRYFIFVTHKATFGAS